MEEIIYSVFENVISVVITSLVVSIGYILTSLVNKLKSIWMTQELKIIQKM